MTDVRARNPFGFRFVSPLLIGTLLNPVNSAMIATALVPIGHDLHAGPASTVWLVAGLYLAAAVGQPTMGRVAELHGPRKVLVAQVSAAVGPTLGGLLVEVTGWRSIFLVNVPAPRPGWC